MLSSLTLKNLATISDTSVEFRNGLNILTGETGTGKSILIDGLLLTLGQRADRNLVRPGASAASVEALFTTDSGEEYIVRREVRSQGRSRFFINDELATLEEGRTLIAGLVDLHSQDSTPALLSRQVQMRALDEYGGTTDLARRVSEAYRGYVEANRRVIEIADMLDDISRRRDLAVHELSLIDDLDPSEEDHSLLIEERKRLKAEGDSAEALSRVVDGISGDDGIGSGIRSLSSPLRSSNMDLSEILDLLEQAEIALSEASDRCEAILSRVESAPWRLEEIDERLDGYSHLLGRCGGSMERLLQRREELNRELAGYDSMEKEHDELTSALPGLEADLLSMAGELSEARREAALELEGNVRKELMLLGMPDADFRVVMEKPQAGRSTMIGQVSIGSFGGEMPVFHFSANPGMDPGPLSSVASGGEMSRVSLVLKLALSNVTQAPTMIFDEIDSGVGGETANLLAESLSRVSGGRQVIVITHLPQIASRAHWHLAVTKEISQGLPVTRVRALAGAEDRVEELTRLLGGGNAAREHAEKMVAGGGPSEEKGSG